MRRAWDSFGGMAGCYVLSGIGRQASSLFSADVIRKFFRFCRIFGLTQWTKTWRRMTETVRQWDGEESVKSK